MLLTILLFFLNYAFEGFHGNASETPVAALKLEEFDREIRSFQKKETICSEDVKLCEKSSTELSDSKEKLGSCDYDYGGVTPRDYGARKDGIANLKARIVTTGIEGASASEISAALENIQKLSNRMQYAAQRLRMCIFKREIQGAIADTVGENRKLLEKLSDIGTCLDKDRTQGGIQAVKSFFRNSFEDIFQFFHKSASRRGLTNQDCRTLEAAYQVWSSFYDSDNSLQLKNTRGPKIPLHNVNPHNASFYYWGAEKEKQNQDPDSAMRFPLRGLPVLHADSHTDLGHVHNHSHQHWGGKLDLKKLVNLSVIRNDSEFIQQLISSVQTIGVNTSEIIKIEVANLRLDLQQEIENRVHFIAQPLVAGALTDAVSEFIMFMPPWNHEFPRTKPEAPIPAKLVYIDDGTTQAVQLAVTDCSKYSRFDITCCPTCKVLKSEPISVLDANYEGDAKDPRRPKDRIVDYLEAASLRSEVPQDKRFVLDIDLDFLVSNGTGGKANPVSYHRTDEEKALSAPRVRKHRREYGTSHKKHHMRDNPKSNESDPRPMVTVQEFELIRQRTGEFFRQLAEAKTKGYNPAVITISDSTTLTRAVRGSSFNENQDGGDFLPSCLAFLVNYTVRKGLHELYDLDERTR